MEHIVQFAIGIDDEAITKHIQQNAEKIITQNLQQRVERCIFETDYLGKVQDRLNYHADSVICAWLDKHRDTILQFASETLSKKMINTKAVKTAINEVLKEGEV